MTKKKRTIGRTDKIDFPELGLFDLPVKIDSGAYTSSLHCSEIKEVKRQGQTVLEFNLLDPEHEQYNGLVLSSKEFSQSQVKSSSGHLEERYVISTTLVVFGKSYDTLLTLTDRTDMRYPVLIGRRLLKKNFVVDVSKKNLSFKRARKIKSTGEK